MRKIILLTIVFVCMIQKIVIAQYWSALGRGIGHLYTYNYCDGGCDGYDAPVTGPPIASMCIYKGELYAAGFFDYLSDINGYVNNIAKWNGAWSAVGSGLYTIGGGGYDAWVNVLAVYKGELYAGGYFTDAGGVQVNNIAKWDGTRWTNVGNGLGSYGYSVSSLVVYNEELYAGGYFYNSESIPVQNIAKWNGTTWSALGTGIKVYADDYFHGAVGSLVVHNGALYAGGYFDSAGNVAAKNIAKWNGTDWSSVGEGIESAVSSMASYHGKLYAGGAFAGIQEWDGAKWLPLTPAIGGSVYSLTVYNGDLIAGGYVDTAGGVAAKNIARWNGTSWSAMGNGISSGVLSLTTDNDVLYAGGNFSTAGNVLANRIAVWKEQCTSAPGQPGDIIKATTSCQNAYAVYSVDPVTDAADFTWNLPPGWSGSSSSNQITVLVGTDGGTISVTANNPCGSSSAQTLQVNPENLSIQIDTIKGNKTVCKDSYQVYSVSPVPEATKYIWILPSDWTGYSTTNTISAKAGTSDGTISVKAKNNCNESNVQVINVRVKDFAIPTVDIKGNIFVSVHSTQEYSVTAITGALDYFWKLNGGGNITSGQNTNLVTIKWNDIGDYNLSLKIFNGCGIVVEKNIMITVVEKPDDLFEIKILPNPSSGEFYFTARRVQDKIIRIDVLNMIGQTVYKTKSSLGSNNYTQLLHLHRLAPGMYVMNITIDDKIYTRKIVKK